MLTVMLAGSGGRVLIPNGAAIVQGPTYNEIHCVDSDGQVLVIFQRPDLAMYADNGDAIPAPQRPQAAS